MNPWDIIRAEVCAADGDGPVPPVKYPVTSVNGRKGDVVVSLDDVTAVDGVDRHQIVVKTQAVPGLVFQNDEAEQGPGKNVIEFYNPDGQLVGYFDPGGTQYGRRVMFDGYVMVGGNTTNFPNSHPFVQIVDSDPEEAAYGNRTGARLEARDGALVCYDMTHDPAAQTGYPLTLFTVLAPSKDAGNLLSLGNDRALMVKLPQQPAIEDLTAPPTAEDYNRLLGVLRAAGIIAAS